jgi:signal transduction histidine kinase
VKVEMSAGNIRFEILVNDNGVGFDPEEAQRNDAPRRGGNGLGNMQERLSKTGGRCTLRSRPGEGATVILSIPLDRPDDFHS